MGAGLLLGAMLSLAPALSMAANVDVGGGAILRQIQPPEVPTPSNTNAGLKKPGTRLQPVAAGVSFKVTSIRIIGNTLLSTAVLHPLIADSENKSLNMKQLNALANRLSAYYHQQGYSLTRAVIPAQEIKDGVVTIQIVEAHYGKINLKNHSRVRDGLLQSTLSPLHSGNIIQDYNLNKSLLLISDIPGVSAEATLKPGQSVATADMQVVVQDTPRLSARLTVDNFGNQFTGRIRGGLALQLNNPLHLGDQLNFYGLTTGNDIKFGVLNYQVVLNGYGTRLGGGYSVLDYMLGGALANLNGHGTAYVGNAWLRQPLYRSRTLNMYVQLQYNHKRLHDRIDVSSIRTDRQLQSGSVSLSGDLHDNLLITSAVTGWNLQWTAGDVNFDDPTAAMADAATARTAGHFSKWNATLTRLHGLSRRNSLWLSLSGQWAQDNLDSVEKLVVGGPYGVRAYDVGILSADSGYLAQLELRHQFNSNWQLFGFIDHQRVRINQHPFASGTNYASLTGGGAGIRFDTRNQWHAEAYVGAPIGSTPSLISNRSSVRAWVQLSKGF